MTEDPEPQGMDEPPATERVRTGDADVDAVVVAVEGLENAPVEEHVGVFESAHEQLRRALDNQPRPS